MNWKRRLEREEDTLQLGSEISLWLARGDMIALSGGLGSGKTTLARAIIRALSDKLDEDVPSPTFTLVQTYMSARIPAWHFDLYRIKKAQEIFELGFEEAEDGVCLIEWPDRMEDYLPRNYLEIKLAEDGEGRIADLTGHGGWGKRLERSQSLYEFLHRTGWGKAERKFMQGDASTRTYERLALDGQSAILMNAPPKPSESGSYSQRARLAQDMRPFAIIGDWLCGQGFSAPRIMARDLEQGFLLLEDLGEEVYAQAIADRADMDEPYEAAVMALLELRDSGLPDGLPVYDESVYLTEAGLLTEWFWPSVKKSPAGQDELAEYEAAWRTALRAVSDHDCLVLRDYHSPNLLWLPARKGAARAGIIDFQDALAGHPAYDLVSLLQDARVDVPPEREAAMLDLYCEQAGLAGKSRDEFLAAYAVLGAQRASKILGIFTRLAERDNKPGYLKHMPRLSNYLAHNLDHPALLQVRQWFESHLPEALRID